MQTFVFDSSVHLGQFTQDEKVRYGCKNTQAWFGNGPAASQVGTWTDAENGRTDCAIWNMHDAMQSKFYPFMDRYFSIMNVRQEPMAKKEEDIAYDLREEFPQLQPISRQTFACAIAENTRSRQKIFTLFSELLEADVVRYMDTEHGIPVEKPNADEEKVFKDSQLERRYQLALQAFQKFAIDPLTQLQDSRVVSL